MGVVPLPPGYAVREFRPADAEAFTGYREEMVAAGLEPDDYLAELAAGGCFTVLKDDIPVACAGITVPVEGQETVWALLGEDVRKHPKLHLKIARQFLVVAEREYQPQYFFATAEVDNPAAHNWLEHLGFTRGDAVLVRGKPQISFTRARTKCP